MRRSAKVLVETTVQLHGPIDILWPVLSTQPHMRQVHLLKQPSNQSDLLIRAWSDSHSKQLDLWMGAQKQQG